MNKFKGYSTIWLLVLLLVSFVAGCARNDTVPLNADKVITSYAINGVSGVITEATIPKTITVHLPYLTPVIALKAAFTFKGTGVMVSGMDQVSGATANDFTTVPVDYIVTAQDNSTSTYKVTVIVDSISAKAITSYAFGLVAGAIDETAKTITVHMPYLTSVTALKAAFTTTGTSVKVTGVTQDTGNTANNFTAPVDYIVTAQDNSIATYKVTVIVDSASAKAITSYSIGGIAGVITEGTTPKTITVLMPAGTPVTDLNTLIAKFTTTGINVKVTGVTQVSETTVNDFTPPPVAYIVTAQDNSTATYNVTVTIDLNTTNAITSYKFGGVAGAIDETAKTIVVNMPYGTDVTNLTATFTSTGQGNPTLSGVDQLSGTTSNDFTIPVDYIVTAENPAFVATYKVTVIVPLGINLRGAATFGIAARDGLTSTGVTVINGDVALYPTATCTDSTGNSGASQPCLVKTYASVTGMTVNGSIYWAGDPFDNGGTANAVSNDLNIAWVEGKNKVDTFATGFLVGELGASGPDGKILLPGVYHEAALGLAAGNVVTFDAQNDANAIFIIKVDSTFVDSGTLLLPTQIKLANGAQARNIWFVAGLDITIGSGTTWNGNILAGRTATILDGSTVNGRVLAGATGAGAITLTGAASPSVTTISVPQ